MNVSNKAELVAYLKANFNWLLNDLNGMAEGAFTLRETFLDGSEKAAREIPPGASETPPPTPAADGVPQEPINGEIGSGEEVSPTPPEPVVSSETTEPTLPSEPAPAVLAEGSGAGEQTAPAASQPSPSVDMAAAQIDPTAPIPAVGQPPLTDAEHEAKQDADIAELKKKLGS